MDSSSFTLLLYFIVNGNMPYRYGLHKPQFVFLAPFVQRVDNAIHGDKSLSSR